MEKLTSAGEQAVQRLSQRYSVSADAVRVLLDAVSRGRGTMAQFSHPDLGGHGQWMQGGMTMVGDMFNNDLQAKVAGLCSDLSSLLGSAPLLEPGKPVGNAGGAPAGNDHWWPSELGNPSTSGGQNDARYAYFPDAKRLAVLRNGKVEIRDTLDHRIGGVQQQQGSGAGTLEFTSQNGTFKVEALPLVDKG